jgi:DNA polymerase-1
MKNFNTKNALFIIDGSSFLYRAYYGVRPLTTTKGVPVHAVYGFCRMIKRIIDSFNPSHFIVAWDSHGPTVRHDIYPAYKSTRQAPPSDLTVQKDLIKQFADSITLPQIHKIGIEADDLMYSLALDAKKRDQTAIIITADKDLGQVLQEKIVIFDPFKDILITAESLEAKLGFSINKLVFYYALIGDSSDAIPGVKGVGPKTALDLVQKFDSLEHLYNNLDQVEKVALREKLKLFQHDAFLSEQLFQIKYYNVEKTEESVLFNAKNWNNALDIFKELEFHSLVKTIVHQQQTSLFSQEHAYKADREFILIQTEDQLITLCEKIKAAGGCALDTETTGLLPLEDNLVGISVCIEEGIAYYIPCGHTTGELQLSLDSILKHIKPIFEDNAIKKYIHNAQFDMLVLEKAGIILAGLALDTMIAAHLLGNEAQRVGLKYLSEHFFNEPMQSFAHMVKKTGCATFDQISLDQAVSYAAHDAHQTFLLARLCTKKLTEESLLEYYTTIEQPLLSVLLDLYKQGISVDQQILEQLDLAVMDALTAIKKSIASCMPQEQQDINLNAPRQIEHLLFTVLGLKPVKKTAAKTGYSTDFEVLQELAKTHHIPGFIIRYRELAKLKSTYIEGLKPFITDKNNTIHTTLSQISTATGRLSSYDPNLQNIPVDSLGLPIHIRSAFIAGKNKLFIALDYSQIELRVLAYLSQDKELIQAFTHDQDIHIRTAAHIFQIPLNEVTSEQRQMGKKINFSILYGLTPYGLSKDLEISFKQAQLFIDRYFACYTGVREWMNKTLSAAQENGYVTTLWGRKRVLPSIYEKNKNLHEAAERMAINTVAQGTAAEIMKLGMIRVHALLKTKQLPASIVLQIHDEILVTVEQEKAQEISELIKKELESVVTWNIPLQVSVKIGANWEEASK